MARTLSPKSELILAALTANDGGAFIEKTSRNILFGSSRMDSLEKALKMEEHYNISPYTWIKLFKKGDDSFIKESRAGVYQLKKKKEKSSIENDLLFEALMSESGGYKEDAAKNIVYGVKPMSSLTRALKMELNYDLAPSVWGKLYRG